MTIRAWIIVYLSITHLVIAAIGAVLLWEENRPWIIALEILLLLSLYIGLRLASRFKLPSELMVTGADLIREKDFAHTFSEVSSKDLNRLIKLYNEMIKRLREERIHSQEQQAFLKKMLEASPAGVITLDLEGRIDIINKTALSYLSDTSEKVLGQPLGDLESELAKELETIESGDSSVLLFEGRRKLKCIHDHYFDRGFVRSFYLLIELTEELRKSEKQAYEKLIRTLSHEVNNTVGAANSILRSCLVYSTQVSEDDREDFESALNVAIDRTDRLNTFMKGYADVVRLPDPIKTPVDLKELLDRLVHLLSTECAKRNIRIQRDYSIVRDLIEMDIAQMEQAIVNILKNAMEAIDRDGEITIRFTRHDSELFLEIIDTGSGLAPEVQADLFTPFFSTKPHGQGIGLTLVSEILTRHNFLYSLTSSKGVTTFAIQFS